MPALRLSPSFMRGFTSPLTLEHLLVFGMVWIDDGADELDVARHAADVVGWAGIFTGIAVGMG